MSWHEDHTLGIHEWNGFRFQYIRIPLCSQFLWIYITGSGKYRIELEDLPFVFTRGLGFTTAVAISMAGSAVI